MSTKATKPVIQISVFLLFGLVVGILAPVVLGFPAKWAFLLLSALIIPFVAFLSGNIKQFFLTLLVLSLPLRININLVRDFVDQAGASSIDLSITDLLLIALYILWFIEIFVLKVSDVRFFPKTTVPAIIYIEIALISLTRAVKMNIATFELLAMVKAFLIYFYAVNNISDRKSFTIVAWAFLGTVIFESLLGIFQYTMGSSLNLGFLGEQQIEEMDEENLIRVGGTLGHPNRLSMFLELLLPLCATLFFWFRSRSLRLFSISAFILGVITLVLTGSRGGWIAFLAAIIFLAVILVRKRFVSLRFLIKPAFLIFIALIGITFSYWTYLEERVKGDDRGSAQGRIPMFEIAISMIQANPFLGVGLNNYAEVMQDYNDKISALRYRLRRPVHNIYLLIAAEIGIFGLLAFLWFSIASFHEGKKGINAHILPESMMIAGLVAGLFAFYLHGMVDKHSPGGSQILFFLIGFLIASSRLASQRQFDKQGEQGESATGLARARAEQLLD